MASWLQRMFTDLAAMLLVLPGVVLGGTSDLALTAHSAPDRIVPNQLVTCRILVTNHGPDTAFNVTITNQLPADAGVFSVWVSQGTVFTNSGALRLAAGTLAPGAELVAEVKLSGSGIGLLTNSFWCAATGDDPAPKNNGATNLTEILSGTFIAAGQIQIPRAGHTATLLDNGRVLITGGYNATQRLASVELYDPVTGTSMLVGTMLMPRYAHTATLLPDGKVVIAGHSFEDGMRLWTEIYDPVSNTLSQTGDMNVARTQHAASVLPDGRVLLTGGRPSNPTAAETYDHLTGLWTLLPPIPAALVAHSSTVLPHGEVLLVGGCTIPPPPATVFVPSGNTYYHSGPGIQCRQNHSATLLPDGRVLIAGGGYASGNYPVYWTADLFDPATLQFSATGRMADARATHTASLLTNGTVLVAGGTLSQDAITSEIFNPTTGLFSPTAPLQRPRLRHTATTLADGSVLILGGEAGSQYQASAEIYDPNRVLAPPIVSISDVANNEDAPGALAFPVNLSAPMAVPVSFHYSLSIESAWWDEDFVRTNGVLSFAPGTTNLFLTVPLIPDNIFETDEILFVTISNAANAVIARNTATGTILNDDPFPTASVLPTSVVESNLLTSRLVFPVVLSNPSYQHIDLNYATTDETAIASLDYESTNGLLSFNPGVMTQLVSVIIKGDVQIESDEGLWLEISNPTNAVIGGPARGTILNDDGFPGAIHYLELDPVGSPQHHSVPFAASVTARDTLGQQADFSGPILLRAPSANLSNIWFNVETDAASDWRGVNFTYTRGYFQLMPYDVPGHGTLSMALRLVPSSGKAGGVARDVFLIGGVKYLVSADVAQANENTAFQDHRFDYTLKLGGAVVGRLLLDQLGQLSPGQVERRVISGQFTAPSDSAYTLEVLIETSFPASHSAVYVDNIRIEAPGASPGLVFLTNGAWSGSLALPGTNSNLVLEAFDYEGHKGASNPFRLDPNANLSVKCFKNTGIARAFDFCDFTLTTANAGPSRATNVVITNTLPDGFTFVRASGTMTCSNIGNSIVCVIPALSAGASTYVYLTSRAGAVGLVTNHVSGTALEFDSDISNNMASIDFEVFPPRLTVLGTTVTEIPGGTNATINLVLTSSNNVPVSVQVQTTNGTAMSNLDYVPISLQASFPAGVRTQSVVIPILDDLVDETNETLSILLNNCTNAVLTAPGSATITILDDDLPTLAYSKTANGLRFDWGGSYGLESNSVLGSTGWVLVTNHPPITITLRSNGTAFFRLASPR